MSFITLEFFFLGLISGVVVTHAVMNATHLHSEKITREFIKPDPCAQLKDALLYLALQTVYKDRLASEGEDVGYKCVKLPPLMSACIGKPEEAYLYARGLNRYNQIKGFVSKHMPSPHAKFKFFADFYNIINVDKNNEDTYTGIDEDKANDSEYVNV